MLTATAKLLVPATAEPGEQHVCARLPGKAYAMPGVGFSRLAKAQQGIAMEGLAVSC